MGSHCTEALDYGAGSVDLDCPHFLGDFSGYGAPKAGGSQCVQRNAAHDRGQPDNPPDLILDLGHVGLGQSHVGTRDVVGHIPHRMGECPHQSLLGIVGHVGIGDDPTLGAAMSQPGSSVLERHRTGQSEHLIE